MKELRQKIGKYLQAEMLQKMWKEFRWIFQYARRYWKAMLFYTALGIFGTGVSLASSVISKDLVDIITGHQTGKLIQTFALMIGFSFGILFFIFFIQSSDPAFCLFSSSSICRRIVSAAVSFFVHRRK